MVRDPGLQLAPREDVRNMPALAPASPGEKPKSGPLCVPSDGHMLGAQGQGRAMDRVGPARAAAAPAIPGPAPTIHNGRRHAGWVYLNENQLSDDATRARLTARATATVRALPPKE